MITNHRDQGLACCPIGQATHGPCPIHDKAHEPLPLDTNLHNVKRIRGESMRGGEDSDWERGYAKGYDRALQQLAEAAEFHLPKFADLVRELTEKLMKEALEP